MPALCQMLYWALHIMSSDVMPCGIDVIVPFQPVKEMTFGKVKGLDRIKILSELKLGT